MLLSKWPNLPLLCALMNLKTANFCLNAMCPVVWFDAMLPRGVVPAQCVLRAYWAFIWVFVKRWQTVVDCRRDCRCINGFFYFFFDWSDIRCQSSFPLPTSSNHNERLQNDTGNIGGHYQCPPPASNAKATGRVLDLLSNWNSPSPSPYIVS